MTRYEKDAGEKIINQIAIYQIIERLTITLDAENYFIELFNTRNEL